MYIEIAVGVRRRQVTVVDPLPGELQRITVASCLIRSRCFRQRSKPAFKRDGSNRVTQVHPGFFMSDDDAAVAAHGLVRACLLRMPVRVDQCVYATGAGSFLDGLEQGIGIRRKPAIDHQCAVFTAHGNHIAAGALEECEGAEIRR